MKKFINPIIYANFKRKIQCFSLIFMLMASFQSLYGQVSSFCGTEISPGYTVPQINFTGNTAGEKNLNDPYIVRVYFHILRDDNGLGGQDKSVIPTVLQNLNTAFAAHNISFESTCYIDEIKNTVLFDAALTDATLTTMKTNYGHSNGIDIFLGKDNSGGRGLSILAGTALWLNGTYVDNLFGNDELIIPSQVVAHEMGHCLGLFHTFQYTYPPTSTAELVGSNSSTTGDMIPDTEADPGITGGLLDWPFGSGNIYTVLDANCNWLPNPNITDANGNQFIPDSRNFMSYTIPACMSKFSAGQANVMRYNLLNLPALTACIVNSNIDRVIAANTTENWTLADADANGDIFMTGDVIVKDGASLTISEDVKVHFSGKTSLIIKPNGLLTLYGTLTSTDECKQWNGVVVSGSAYNTNYSQFQVNGRYEQGRLRSYSTATIENALVAVKLYTAPNPQDAGGIIYANGTTFKNNGYGVIFKPFNNFWPYPTSQQGQPRDYQGSFTDCHFEITPTYELSDKFHSFMDMAGVKGVRVYGSSFENTHILNNATEIADYGYGIKAQDSRFSVLPICNILPCDYPIRSSFDGLGTAIHVSTVGSTQPYLVKLADFENCYVGINNQYVSNATIILNDFYLGNLPDLSVDTNLEPGLQNDQLGILLEYDTDGYTVEENDFIKKTGGNIESASVGFTIGILSSATGQFSNEIRKNTFEGETSSSEGVFMGNMAQKSNGGGGTGLVFLCNDYHDGGFADMYVPQDVTVLNTINRHQREYIELSQSYAASGNTFDNSNSSFVHTAAQDVVYYYDINEPDEMLIWPFGLFDVNVEPHNTCASNYCEPPCKPKTEIDLIKLDFPAYKNAETVSKSAYDLAFAGGNIIQIAQTEATYAADKQKVDAATFTIALHALYDDTNFDQQEVDTWLLNKQAYGTDILLATQKQFSGNTTEAMSIINNMPSRFDLTTAQIIDISQLSTLFGLLQGQSPYAINTGTLNSLEVLAANEEGVSSSIARNLLTYHGYNFTPRYTINLGSHKSLTIDKEDNSKKNTKVAVYPNPASTQVNFTFNFDDKEPTSHQLKVVDISGKVLLTQDINNEIVRYTWNTTTVSDGIYFYRISSEGVSVESGKILIQK